MIALLFLFVSLGRLYREMLRQPETRALLLISSLILIIGVVFYMNVEHWSLPNSIYFCVVTLATVGYGDFTPTTPLGRIFTTIYIIIGLSVIGGFFATVGRMISHGRIAAREESLLERGRARFASGSSQDDVEQPGHDRPAE